MVQAVLLSCTKKMLYIVSLLVMGYSTLLHTYLILAIINLFLKKLHVHS